MTRQVVKRCVCVCFVTSSNNYTTQDYTTGRPSLDETLSDIFGA